MSDVAPQDPSLEGKEKKKDEEDRGLFAWFWGWYKRYDTWLGRWMWLLGFMKAHTIATVIVVAAIGAGAAVIASPDLRQKFFNTPVEVATENWGSSVIFPIEGEDSQGRSAAFDVAVLPTNLTWAHQSTTTLTQAGVPIPNEEVSERLLTPELRAGLARSNEIIAVGLASQEGQRDTETRRARARARSAAAWLATSLDEKVGIWTLNLGQFQGDCQAASNVADTGWQRPVVVVGIRAQEPNVILTEAFADAISGKSNLPSRDCYSSFDLERFR